MQYKKSVILVFFPGSLIFSYSSDDLNIILQINSSVTHGAWRRRGLPYSEYPSDNREKTDNQLKSPSRLSYTQNNWKKRRCNVNPAEERGTSESCKWTQDLSGVRHDRIFEVSRKCLNVFSMHAFPRTHFPAFVPSIRVLVSLISRWSRLAGAGLLCFGSAHGWQTAEPSETAGFLRPPFPQ